VRHTQTGHDSSPLTFLLSHRICQRKKGFKIGSPSGPAPESSGVCIHGTFRVLLLWCDNHRFQQWNKKEDGNLQDAYPVPELNDHSTISKLSKLQESCTIHQQDIILLLSACFIPKMAPLKKKYESTFFLMSCTRIERGPPP
jgi:hypothetical protein